MIFLDLRAVSSADPEETLANPDWRSERVEPGDQDANGPYRTPAKDADTADEPTQEQVDEEIRHEDIMLQSPYVNIPHLEDPYEDPYGAKSKKDDNDR